MFSVIIGVLFIQRYFDTERSREILQTTLEERKKAFDVSLESEGEIFKTFIDDYSFWDEMVDFVKTSNKEFASNNLETGLETYKASALWVYSPSGKLVYSKSSDPEKPLNAIPLSADFFSKLNNEKFIHFYLEQPEGIIEVRAATIVPGDDPEHNSPPNGYFVIARYLGDEFITKMQTLSQSSVKFEQSTDSMESEASGESVSFSVPLNDLSDKTIQLLNSESEVAVIKSLNSSYNKQLTLLIGAGFVIMAIILSGLWLFVLRPIHLISRSIKQKDPRVLDNISKSKSQFGELAKVVQEFFSQKVAIQEAETKRIELEKLNKEKAAFLSIAAQELKSPGTIISLMSESVTRSATKNKVPASVISDLNTITHQSKKMTSLVNDLRSAAEGKKMIAREQTVFDFDKFLEQEVTELGYIIDQKIVLSGHTKQKIQADEQHLSQVVSNLIRNAAKYSGSDTQIHINSSVKGGEIIVEFIDQGLGISEKDQHHLFEQYFRADNVKGSIEGLGLGLSICHDIIKSMGGKIWVKSAPGKGSHFYFSLQIKSLSPKPENLANKKSLNK